MELILKALKGTVEQPGELSRRFDDHAANFVSYDIAVGPIHHPGSSAVNGEIFNKLVFGFTRTRPTTVLKTIVSIR